MGFFSGKLQVIQGKLNILSHGIQPCIPSILDTASILKDWKDWSTSFYNILTQEATVSIFEDILDIPYKKLIDSVFEE